ncbi:TPA: hypothetical protein I7759_14535 [Vibrio vulnificus]|nr:hypothetical protein [Vibrio vulnificus]
MQTLEINQEKVLNTRYLLLEVIESPENYRDNDGLLQALASQGKLAKYSDENLKIVACSLNTMKNIADSLLDRGFAELDELRKSAKESILESGYDNAENEKTKSGAVRKSKRLELELDETRRSNFLLSLIIKELRCKIKQIAETDDSKELRIDMYKDVDEKVEIQLNYTLRGEEVVCEKCKERSQS